MSDPTVTTFVAPEISELAPLFPGYDLEILIATGGMGAVYRAVQRSLDRTVAIKILPREFSSDAAFCAGFEAEAKAMAKLNHPNLIGVFDFGEVNGMLFIIMEYVPGKSLYHSSHHQAIDPREVIRILSGVCHGLAHAHEHGILHRDIKPSNILLDLNAEPKIGDFGLARPVDRQVQEGEEIFGTPHYTAPEVLKPPYTVDHRADIFSVGVMLHELLTGKLPADDPRPPSVIIRCDPRFDAIVRRATHPSPQLRYASAAEIAAELSMIADGTRTARQMVAGPVARHHSPAAPAPNAARRPIKPVMASSSSGNGTVFVFVLIAVLAVGAYVIFSPGGSKDVAPPKPTPPAPAAPVVAEPTPAPPKIETPTAPTHPAPVEQETTQSPPTVEIVVDPENEAPSETTDHSAETDHTQPKHSEDAEPTPIFDVAGFFDKALRIMRDKTKDVIATYRKGCDDNYSDFEKGLKRKARRMDYNRDYAEERIAEFLATVKDNDGIVPVVVPASLSYLPEMREVFTDYHEKQETLHLALISGLQTHSATYLLGIELQIKRLNAEEDPVAVKLLQSEIDRTKTEEEYFYKLMLGEANPMEKPKKADFRRNNFR